MIDVKAKRDWLAFCADQSAPIDADDVFPLLDALEAAQARIAELEANYSVRMKEIVAYRKKTEELEAKLPSYRSHADIPHGDKSVLVVPVGPSLNLVVPLPQPPEQESE